MQVLLVSCGAAHLPHIARALEDRNSLAELWISNRNSTNISPRKYRRSWLFHLAIKPFYHFCRGGGITENIFHRLFPLWRFWIQCQTAPNFDVVHAIMGYGSEPFEFAERIGALKVIDASSSHPTSFYGFWQRECDLWNCGEGVGIPRWLYARANRDLERADLILCPSLFVRDSMIYNGISPEKCVLNPYGVDTSVFQPRRDLPPDPRFICVGSICLRKGHQYLFRAFQKVRAAFPNSELICAGGIYPDFRREISRWKGTFTHYQNLPHPELAKLLQNATAFVFPSIEEGFARAVIEGMASGLPIIATHESGATTLVRNEVEGLIVGARDINQLASAMIRSATRHDENKRMGQASYLRGGRDNSWGDYADRLLKLYGVALSVRQPASLLCCEKK